MVLRPVCSLLPVGPVHSGQCALYMYPKLSSKSSSPKVSHHTTTLHQYCLELGLGFGLYRGVVRNPRSACR